MSRAIGALQAQTDLLLETQRAHNHETRAIRDDLQSVKTDIAVIRKDVADFAPAARKVRKWEQRAVGMSLFGGVSGAVLIAYIRGKLGL